jgi:phage terminase large subunit-like protein
MNPGERAVKFINNLRHTKGKFAGQRFNLRKWQAKDIIIPLFGTVDKKGKRQYRTLYLEIPRKNGKTEKAAGIALYLTMGDGEQGAEVYGAAADRDQASIVYNVAAEMVNNDKVLRSRIRPVDSKKTLVYGETGSIYRAISAEAATKHGYNTHGLIYDELHAAPNRELYDVLTTSMGAREQPLTVLITTAGYDKNSICYEMHEYARKVLKGEIEDPTFLPVIYAADEEAGDDWEDERIWHKANPALGDFRSLEEMRIAYRRAKEIPAQQNIFKRLYLNMWTEQETRWIDISVWDACKVDDFPDLHGRQCWAGLDLASTQDLTAFVMIFPNEGLTHFEVVPVFWLPQDTIERRVKSSKVPYDKWVREGLIRVTPGNVTDYDRVREDIKTLSAQFRINEIAYDRWNASQLVTQLMEDGANMVEFGQGFASMSAPTKELEKLLVSGAIAHDGNDVLRWMARNVSVTQDPAGNLKPNKKTSSEKIDGIVALIMALGRVMVRENTGPSVYETRGIITL